MKSWSVKRKIFSVIAVVAVMVSGVWLYPKLQDPVPPLLRAVYPHIYIQKISGQDHYTFGNKSGFEFDFFAREINLGGVPFYVIAENGPEGASRYVFFGMTPDPELLIEVEKTPYVDSTKQAFEENIVQVDITGDGKEETFVRRLSEDGYLTYTILQSEGETLKEIHLDPGLEHWTNIKYVGVEDGVVLFKHDPEGEFNGDEFERYYLTEDSLIPESEAKRKEQSEKFRADLTAALEDPKWSGLAQAFDDNCEILPGSVLQSEGAIFRPMIEQMEPVKIQSDGSKVYIIPCMLHAYQMSYISAFYDGETYHPMWIEGMDYEGNLIGGDFRNVGLEYNPSRDLFTSYAKGRGMGDCGDHTEYKLVDRRLAIQKYEADTECDGKYETRVIYDANN